MTAGHDDLAHAADSLASRVPPPLAGLARLAYNYRWSWAPGGHELFASVDRSRWERCGENPVRLLGETGLESLARAASDHELLERVDRLEQLVDADLARPAEPTGTATAERPIAYFCAEFGVHRSLPVYSGGLGALAGDILKESSDRAMPLVAVGLMYRQGYFRQRIDARGWQHEYWVDTDPERLPAALVTGDDGAPITITVPVRGIEVTAQIWRVDVGRVPLYLLDTERPENDLTAKWITSRLYIGEPDARLAQYVLLGVGGVRALAAMGIEPALLHLNEGHAAFISLEAARANGATLEAGLEAARARTIFTTHTPVPAGNDTYPAGQVVDALGGLTASLGVDPMEIIRLGRTRPDDDGEDFGVSQFALRTSRAANGVSRRHGEVARRMWQDLWPGRALDEVPIGHVTNGVHVPTWIGSPMRELLCRYLGDDWLDRQADPATWAGVDDIPDEELWEVRCRQRATLVDYVRTKSVTDRLGRDEPRNYVEAAATLVRPGRLDGRLRAPARHVQAPPPARAGRRPCAGAAQQRPARPAGARRQGPPARRGRQADGPAPVHVQVGAGDRRPRRLPRRLRPLVRRADGPRLRRLAQPAAPAARGERHERDEVGGQRRAPAQRARRLVGRGLRRRERLGAARRRGPRPRGAGPPRRRRAAPAARARRSRASSTTATRPASRAPGSRA